MDSIYCFGCMELIEDYPCPKCGYASDRSAHGYALKPGTRLQGKYLVGKMLGQGGFGITYIGMDLKLRRKIAIKEYYPASFVSRKYGTGQIIWHATETARQAQLSGQEVFLKEARKMSRVEGIDSVVHVFDVFQENNTAYIVMDFIEGKTLQSWLQKAGPLPWESVRAIFMPVIQTMSQVHRLGLIHRDISPDNLMLLPDGRVKILDLGAAKDLNINSGNSSMQVAKSGFSPLEQYVQSIRSGTWTDVYSMAATMYYTLTGVLPPSAIDRTNEDTLRWDLPQLQAVPPSVCTAMKNAMATRSEDRTQTMDIFYGELLGNLQPAKKSRKPRKLPKWLIPAAAVFAAVVVAAAVLSGISSNSRQPENLHINSGSTPAATPSDTDLPTGQIEQLKETCTREVYEYNNGSRMELYFNGQDSECLRIFVDETGAEKFVFLAEYDSDGNILEYTGYENGQLMRRTAYTRNADGNATRIEHYVGGALLETSEYTYDSQGRDIACTRRDGSGNIVLDATSTYDADGAETYTGTHSGGERFLYLYRPDGQLQEYFNYAPDGTLTTRCVSTYDSSGRLLEDRWYHSDGTENWTEYHYDGDRLTGSTTTYPDIDYISECTFLYGPRGIRFGSSYSYDDGSLSEYESVTDISGSWCLRSFSHTPTSREVYSTTYYDWDQRDLKTEGFDINGNLTSLSESVYSDTGEHMGTKYTRYDEDGAYTVSQTDLHYNTQYYETYSSDGRLLNRTDYRYDADGTMLSYLETEYNEDGSFTKTEVDSNYHTVGSETYDSSGSLLSTAAYEYDASGKRIGSTVTVYYYDGSYTVTVTDANYKTVSEKTYDKDGNLLRGY